MSSYYQLFNKAVRASKRQAAGKRLGGAGVWKAKLLPIVVERLMAGIEPTIRSLAEAIGEGGIGAQYVGNVLGDGVRGNGVGLHKDRVTPSRLLLVKENADLIAVALGEQGLTALLSELGKSLDEYVAWRDSLPSIDLLSDGITSEIAAGFAAEIAKEAGHE